MNDLRKLQQKRNKTETEERLINKWEDFKYICHENDSVMAEFYDAFMLSDEGFIPLLDYYFQVASKTVESSYFVDNLSNRSLNKGDVFNKNA